MSRFAQLHRYLFRLRRDHQLPIILTQRRIFILPTSAGLLFSIVLTVMLIGAINYNLGLGHALIFLLVGVGLAAMVHTFHNLFGLSLMPGRAEPVFAGDWARFPLQVDNVRRRSRRALDFSFATQPTIRLDIPAATQATVVLPYATQRRGMLDPGRLTLSTCYPLGLFYAWSYPHPVLSCLVYPKPIRTPLPTVSSQACAENRHGNGGQEDFAGFRPRQDSDPIRHVAWKAAARNPDEQALLVKQFTGGGCEELWLDWSLTPAGLDDEDRLAILAGWILIAEEQLARYGLGLPTGRIAPAQGAAHRAACLQALALYRQP